MIVRTVSVLIETYWNVNSDSPYASAVALRINRNILECKLSTRQAVCQLPFCINRNILECKGSSCSGTSLSTRTY